MQRFVLKKGTFEGSFTTLYVNFYGGKAIAEVACRELFKNLNCDYDVHNEKVKMKN